MALFILIFEIIGTIAFAVSGAITGLKKNMDIFGVCILGLTTAVGGGIIRDVLAGNTPYILVKHFYATASLLGAAAFILLWNFFGQSFAFAGCIIAVVALRLLAAKFRWSLPKAKDET